MTFQVCSHIYIQLHLLPFSKTLLFFPFFWLPTWLNKYHLHRETWLLLPISGRIIPYSSDTCRNHTWGNIANLEDSPQNWILELDSCSGTALLTLFLCLSNSVFTASDSPWVPPVHELKRRDLIDPVWAVWKTILEGVYSTVLWSVVCPVYGKLILVSPIKFWASLVSSELFTDVSVLRYMVGAHQIFVVNRHWISEHEIDMEVGNYHNCVVPITTGTVEIHQKSLPMFKIQWVYFIETQRLIKWLLWC